MSSAPTSAGGNTFGVVNTGLARSARMPVSFEGALVALHLLGLVLATLGLDLAATLLDVGRVHVARGVQQARSLFQRQRGQQRTIGDDRLEQLGRGAQPVTEIVRHDQGMYPADGTRALT